MEKQLRSLSHELSPLAGYVKFGSLSKDYMGKSPSWLYNKILGRDGNGGKGGFTPEEVESLRQALLKLSDHIRLAAEKL